MTPAQTILSLIEEVDSRDSVKLDKIDFLTWVLIAEPPEKSAYGNYKPPQYTRSRDALKAIRPWRWRLRLTQESLVGDSWMCKIYNKRDIEFMTIKVTEELAELHAIIQALEYERDEK